MLIYTNYQGNDGVDLIFWASKEAYPIVIDNSEKKKITVKNAQAKVVKCAKNKCWVHRNPPHLGHLSVREKKKV